MIRVIQTIGSLAPEMGGPARSVGNLSLALANAGVEVTILSLDFGSAFSPPLVPEHDLINVISVPVQYRVGLRAIYFPGFKNTLRLLCADRENLLIHDHGIWLPQNYIVSRFAAEE